MKVKSILYNPIIDTLKNIVNSDDTEIYSEQAELSGKSTQFNNILGEFDSFIEELEKAKRRKGVFNGFSNIYLEIKNFIDLFPDFPNVNKEKLLFQVILRRNIADMLINSGIDLINKEIDEKLFKVSKLGKEITQTFFHIYNPSDPANCAFFFSMKDYSELEAEIDASVNPDFLYQILPSVDSANLQLGNQYVVTKIPRHDSMIADFINLLLVSKGEHFHEVYKHASPPQVLNLSKIRIAIDYRQQSDTINVLNDYNCRHELITKYLTIYQIIESFMYKIAIVKLESETGDGVFSIRDFKRLYKAIDEKEGVALKNFFEKTLVEETAPGITLTSIFQNDWATFTARITEVEVDKILKLLKITEFDCAKLRLNLNNFENYMSKLVYSVRNSIVHNTETEFHLTNFTLTIQIRELIVSFLIPMLERTIFHLVSAPNDHTWYKKKEIKKY